MRKANKIVATIVVVTFGLIFAVSLANRAGLFDGLQLPFLPEKTGAAPKTASVKQAAAKTSAAASQPKPAAAVAKPAAPTTKATTTTAARTTQTTTAAAVKKPEDTVFSARKPPYPEAVSEAAAWVRDQLEFYNDNEALSQDPGQFSRRFNEGNAAYRRGDYKQAEAIYQEIADKCPWHFGAVNNLALTLLQLEKNDWALRYCILNRMVNPGFYAGWINLDVAGYAMGFSPSGLENMLAKEFDKFPKLEDYIDRMSGDMTAADYNDNALMFAHLYNLLYADMEFDGEINEMDKRMKSLLEENPADEDAQHLQKYWSILRILRQRQLDTPSDWAAEPIGAAVAAGLVPPALQSNYAQTVTRAEFCSLAVALYEKVSGRIAGRTKFTDTDDINVEKAAYAGIVFGVSDGVFEPSGPLTREQAAAMLSRLANAIGKPLKNQASTFSDNGAISDWALEAVGQMRASGIMGGTGDNMFSPQDPYTREQSIVTIMRLKSAI